ncbi:response regulator [Paragemmobacter straminiformis]|uniref:Response regulator transcription factor n=1 Tax=Paragemmobacter straminiformis TaxID=2045119 RepID=A0A842I3P1_9RHOB|nr:response regulator transcription factor [Gemmobacter straminiformis]MBC2834145.1 response regulator transcription factor [Gemmobacter straminiformis]
MPDKSKISILIADDHALLVDMIDLFLQSDGGFTVARADSLQTVVEAIEAEGPFDVILLDLDMPGMHGLQGIETAVKANKGGRVVLFSGQVRQEAIFQALEMGISGFIPKTLSAKSMANAIRFVDSGEIYIPSVLSATWARPERRAQATNISPREMDVLRHICQGKTNKDVARELGLTEITVKMHVRSLCAKMNVTNRTQIAMKSIASGLA